jgi:outer membrane protein OmpA-like peptidoglycan-associated protein
MKTKLAVAIAVAAILAACASAPKKNDQLDEARAQVQTLSQDPLASQAASRELTAARGELQQAESALEKQRPAEEVTHYAYLASRHAETGEARIAEARARERVSQGEAERNRVLLEARTRDASRAQAAAQNNAQAADAARQEALSARADADTAAQQLAALQAEKTKRGMVMTLGDVLFDTGKATLKPGADGTLNRLGEFMRQNPDTKLIVEGHTDSRGSDEYNQQLSQERAQSVASALANRGVTGDRVQAVGRGEGYPVASNDDTGGRQQNRRVEIIFSDTEGRFAQGANDASVR